MGEVIDFGIAKLRSDLEHLRSRARRTEAIIAAKQSSSWMLVVGEKLLSDTRADIRMAEAELAILVARVQS